MKKTLTLFALLTVYATFASNHADTIQIKQHLVKIIDTKMPRSYQNLAALEQTADYVTSVFSKYADTVYHQPYQVNGTIYKNVVAVFGSNHQKTLVVGAHYDVCGNQAGADDNASGLVGLLELARLLATQKLNHRIELVAHSLEEPPFFRTEHMGSFVHAKYLADNNVPVLGMISLEMIGYFSDEKHSQSYPLGILSLFYGNRGDYIVLVKKVRSGRFANHFSHKYKATKAIRTKKFTAPKSLPGIDFSDHRNYWHFGFSALMITDTSFYRNPNYHKASDTIQTLDIVRMAGVIDGVYQALVNY